MVQNITSQKSPNFNARDPQVPLQYIIFHYTGMKSPASALKRLCDPTTEVSAHYLIDDDGHVFHLVDETQRAWHAGKSYWSGVTDLNSASIGIELQNPGHQFGYRAFPKAQINALQALTTDIMRRHYLLPHAVLGHSDVAVGRKEDPGELFPWRELATHNIGLWPVPAVADYEPIAEAELQKLLHDIGYSCPLSGDYDRATRAALLAFQRHYHQENLTGTPEKETVARLKALTKLHARAVASRHDGLPPPAA